MEAIADGRVCIGLDVGGTFTDLFLLDEIRGRTFRHKLPSTPKDPHRGPIQGIREILEHAEITPGKVDFVGLGTTVATNALLERRGARCALITTKGFRDVLEIGRQCRPHAYDIFAKKPQPLVPRDMRFEVEERISADGSVVLSLSDSDLHRVAETLTSIQVESVAICFLNSYANPAHEQYAAQFLRDRLPNLDITTSQELVPEFREYERLSSTVVNAYLMPVMRSYMARFSNAARDLGLKKALFVMNSGGGIFTPEMASQRPIDMLLSGPSGGTSAAIYQAALAGYSQLITFDMGGTSTDVCLIKEGRAELTHARTIDGLPIRSTSVDVHTVGAGGSSVAWIDDGGMLRVGPKSSGADPGPACYGRSGFEPTVTDANVVLGRLHQEYLLDGALKIDANLSRQAIERSIGLEKRLQTADAAAAILAVSNTSIAQAIRFISVERGMDPSDFMLVPFGGAGPLHAADVARDLDMAVLIPPAPGVMCAMGVLTKNVQLDLSQTRIFRTDDASAAEQIKAIFLDLECRIVESLRESNVDPTGLLYEYMIDARYVGQNFEISIPVATATFDIEAIKHEFHLAHTRLYGYDQRLSALELVTFRVKATIPAATPDLATKHEQHTPDPKPCDRRQVFFHSLGDFIECPVYRREQLIAEVNIAGPAIVEQMDTTIIVPPDFYGVGDKWGNLILKKKHEGSI